MDNQLILKLEQNLLINQQNQSSKEPVVGAQNPFNLPKVTETLEYYENGSIFSETSLVDFDCDGNQDYSEVYKYDKNENLESIIFSKINKDGSLDNQECMTFEDGFLSRKLTIQYDDNENIDYETVIFYDEYELMKSKSYTEYDSGCKEYEKTLSYNATGLVTNELFRKFDDNGYKDYSERIGYDENGNIETRVYVAYDDNEHITNKEITDYSSNGAEFSNQKLEYKDGKVAKEILIEDENSDGINDLEVIKAYDSNGEIIDTQFSYTFEADGVIGASRQNRIGDCWLLASINSLSNTPFGSEIIKNAITTNEDGSYSIYFKGIDSSYTITQEEIIEAKLKNIYSKGDVDMLIMELAFEKVFNEKDKIKTGIENLDNDIWDVDGVSENHVLDGGNFNYAAYLLTGKNTESVTNFETLMEINPKTTPTFLYFSNGSKVQDVNGNEVNLCPGQDGAHAWSLKANENGILTIINPYYSDREIKVDIFNFLNLGFGVSVLNMED